MPGDDEYLLMWKQLFAAYNRRRFGEKMIAISRGLPQTDRVGEFKPRNAALGIVGVYPRPGRGPFKEFCSLAHELGHALSWINGTRSAAYEAVYTVADPDTLSEDEKQLIIDEEVRAWQNGYVVAQEVGFNDREGYVAEANLALRWYYDYLTVPPKPFALTIQTAK
jgi:hypothetical protein